MPESNTPDASTDASKGSASRRSLDLLMDVPVNVTVELGRKKMSISELVELTKGATIELEKAAGELLDVRVNDRLVARGEAVIINDKFGVRLTEIVSRSERVQNLS
jgi:flagellar motor switch protein FliN/FliY